MNKIDINKSNEYIIYILKELKLYDFFKKNENIYIGGSLPFLTLSPEFINKKTDKKEILKEIKDIDIYTDNYALLFRNFNKEYDLGDIVKTGVNVTFDYKPKNLTDNAKKYFCNEVPIQIITSSFDSFKNEVLEFYDCDMVCVGYHPFSNEFIIHDRFIKGLEKNQFMVYKTRSNEGRIEKLKARGNKYYNSLVTISDEEDGDYRSYWLNKVKINNINELLPCPPYVQLYGNKYKCCNCNFISDYFLCEKCQKNIGDHLIENKNSKYTLNNLVVFGGVNGLGKIIADRADIQKINTSKTSRTITKNTNTHFNFDLENKLITDDLMEKILNSECVIFNAYQTLENDQNIWTTTLDTFDVGLAKLRFEVNCFGYVSILRQIVEARKKQIANKTPIKDIVFVCMDANESKFENKLSDGKHLELNMAKTAFKQIFYTNAQMLASLGIITIFYDPGWLSYHGISVEKIESKSKYLIPPQLCADVLLNYVKGLDIEDLYKKKKYIHDTDFYSCVKSLDFYKIKNNHEVNYDLEKELMIDVEEAPIIKN